MPGTSSGISSDWQRVFLFTAGACSRLPKARRSRRAHFSSQERFAEHRYDQHPLPWPSGARGSGICSNNCGFARGCARLRCLRDAPPLAYRSSDAVEAAPIRSDYWLAQIATLAREQHRDVGRALLGFYASDFGYTIDLAPEGDPACPAEIRTLVTLRLQHRLIEIGQEAAANSCLYPGALRHYQRLAEVDEQTVEHFGARAAAALDNASPDLQQTYAPRREDLDDALRDQIRTVVDAAIAPLHRARQDAMAICQQPRRA